MTMGPPQAEEALRECLALGADRAIHLSDRVFAVADTLGTSRTLAMALTKEGADLVLCGRKALDSETWQVPPEVAAFLGLAARDQRGGAGRLRRTAAALPRNGLRVRGLRGRAAARRLRRAGSGDAGVRPRASGTGAIDVWQATDLVDDLRENDKRFGQPGSPTRVMAVRDSQPERNRERIEDVDRGGRTDPRAAGRAHARALAVGEAATCRRDPRRALRLLDDDRAGRHGGRGASRSSSSVVGGISRGSSAAGTSRSSSERPRRRDRSSGATAPRSSASWTTKRSPSITRSSGRSPAARARPAAPARAAHPGHGPRPRLRAARRRGARARHDGRLRRRRHRKGGTTAPAEARVRRQHHLRHPRRDDAAARDHSAADVRAGRASRRGRRRGAQPGRRRPT